MRGRASGRASERARERAGERARERAGERAGGRAGGRAGALTAYQGITRHGLATNCALPSSESGGYTVPRTTQKQPRQMREKGARSSHPSPDSPNPYRLTSSLPSDTICT